MIDDEQLNYLLEFLMDSDILEVVEAQIDNFNVFETLGITKMEIRHSNVLAWLLNPNENHGLDDIFTRSFIKHLLYSNKNSLTKEIDIFDASLMKFNQIQVRREWHNIDILLNCELNKLVIVIENKVNSSEHDNQLKRYYDLVCEEFKGYRKIFVYLTPQGDTPSDEENWIMCKYEDVANIIERILSIRSNGLTSNVQSFIQQYIIVLRRYIVGNSELEKRCQEIYYKHQKALDLIFQYKPDIYMELYEHTKALITEYNLILDDSSKSAIRFTTEKLNRLVPNDGEGWTVSKRILLFEFSNKDSRFALRLIIGPGEQEVRERLYKLATKNSHICNKANRSLHKKWSTVYCKEFLKKKDFEDLGSEQLKEIVSSKFKDFIDKDLVQIEEVYSIYK